MMKIKKAIIVFVKYPEKGKVKTRLASSTSETFATEFYNKIVKYIAGVLEKINSSTDIFIFYSPIDDVNKIISWIGNDYLFFEQEGNDLGEKMSNAFKLVFSKEYRYATIIGSDIPDINSSKILAAFEALEKNDVVISPSIDGGYSMLGMNNYYPELFNNITWSTNSVFEKTEQKVKESKLKLNILPILNDIDTEDELKLWMKKSKNNQLKNSIYILAGKENIKL